MIYSEDEIMIKKMHAVFVLLALLCVLFPIVCPAAEVSKEVARQVAENYLNHCREASGQWARSDSPGIVDYQLVEYDNQPVAHNFIVSPSGHILVAYWDEFSPVLLYSTVSEFDPKQVGITGSIASWIIPEISNTYKYIKNNRTNLESENPYNETKVAKAWNWLNQPAERFSPRETSGGVEYSTVGPLLTTIWNQRDPYNLYTPASDTCEHTPTGCVATAWAQLMKYWNWPTTGTGSHSYLWSDKTLSANFDHEYYWSRMPKELTSSSTSDQKDAVARLMADLGVAVEMNYTCDGSGSNAFANDVLDKYFKYKSGMQKISRGSYTASQWFNLFRTEFDAVPARPVVFSIYATSGGGHEVIADGYQTGITDMVHVNLGWSGSYNGYYDVTNNFTTGSYTWEADSQVIVTHIEPDSQASAQIMSLWPVSNAKPGTSGKLWASVKNTGSSALPSNAVVRYYVRGPGIDQFVGSTSASGLAADSSKWFDFDWAIPSTATPGCYTYWAIVYLDSTTPISAWSSPQIFSVGTFTAQITGLWPVSVAEPGASAKLWASVKNTGSYALPCNAMVSYYVRGPEIDQIIGSTSAPGLAAGSSKWYDFDWVIPADASPGNYTYWAIVYSNSTTPISAWSSPQTFKVSGKYRGE
jgi:hypothetical protein